MTLGNILDNCRSHINCIKLVALCKESDFDHVKVYGKVVEDLKILEETGISIKEKFIKGSLIFITGDNLGSHGLGGFVENFSKANYFCRFCLMTRNEFHTEDGPCKIYQSRTVESYNVALNKIEKNDYEGVKFNSVFNELKNFHVCLPGLPPCLGHDLFEGIIAYDLWLLINYFIENKWFSLKQLNTRIEKFNYSPEDRRDKPCTLAEKNTRIPGGACQIWNFLRLFPLLIHDKIRIVDDEVWMLTILLNEIVEIVCSPTIHKSCLPYLQSIIFQYLSERKRLFPNIHLRPKHHYLSHYPELILQFGPLLKVWTMRFESKHRFFKRAIRYILNFINVLKSLSIKHELLQSLIRLGADSRMQMEIHDLSHFQINFYNKEIQVVIQEAGLSKSIDQCSKITVKGTQYKQGHVLLLGQSGYRYNIRLGKICIFLFNEDNIYILYEEIENNFIPYLNAYEVGKVKSYVCQRFEKVSDFKPMKIYNIGNLLCIKPSHGFVSYFS